MNTAQYKILKLQNEVHITFSIQEDKEKSDEIETGLKKVCFRQRYYKALKFPNFMFKLSSTNGKAGVRSFASFLTGFHTLS